MTVAPWSACLGHEGDFAGPERSRTEPYGTAFLWIEASLVLGLSVALDVIVSGVLTYAVGWSPDVALVILLAFSLLGAAIPAGRGAAHHRGAGRPR